MHVASCAFGGIVHVFKHTTMAVSFGFAAILVCMLGSIYVGFQYLDQTRGAWQRDSLFREKVRSAFLMREAVRERSFYLAVAATMVDFFDRDDIRQSYNARAVNFLQARDVLIASRITPSEKKALDALVKRIAELRPSIDRAMELVVESGNNDQALYQMRIALNGQAGVIEEINDLIKVVEAESKFEASAAAEAIAISRRNMQVMSISALALAAIIGLWVTLREARNTARLRLHRDQLEALSSTDALTCIANRRRFNEFLNVEWARAVRSKTPLSLILIDIDHFKKFNDEYGHAAGDACLSEVAKAMRNMVVRSTDLLARYGGEEFACVLPETPHMAAQRIAEKIRSRVEELGIEHKKSSASNYVTISIGIATLMPTPNDDLTQLFEIADSNLYLAKEQGRNKVV